MAYDKKQTDQIWNEFISGKGEDEKFIQKQMDIAAQIDNYLKEKDWTQKKLADEAGLRPSQLSQIMAGEANPTLRTITNLEEALDKDIIVSPDFYEEDLEKIGWERPGDQISVSPGSYGTADVDMDQATTVIRWSGTIQTQGKKYESAKVYQFKPTGS